MCSSSVEQQTLILSDGRSLGYAEFGDPFGFPVFFFHGFGSSCLQTPPAYNHIENVHFYSLDRPGFGQSSFQEKRTLLDWAEDVKEFAEKLQIPRFAVIGFSGGGPHALACAKALPSSMLAGAGIISSSGPWMEAGSQGISLSTRLGAHLVKSFPNLAEYLCLNALKFRLWVKSWYQSGRICQQPVLEPSKWIKALISEAQILAGDWGFQCSDISTKGPDARLWIWHGTRDQVVPIRFGNCQCCFLVVEARSYCQIRTRFEFL
jgi:pimeloyl-ACP methyl ester carboxylesterase